MRALGNDRGQSTVELALALPVMMITAVIAFNALMFFGNCATFDRVFREAVRVYGKPFSCSTVCKHIFQISPDFSVSESLHVQMRPRVGPALRRTSYCSLVKCLSA